jgi:hypothetical protein
MKRFVAAVAVALLSVAPRLALAESEEAPAPTRARHGLSLRAAAGANYARLYDIPTYGGELSLAIGGRDGQRWGYLGLNLERSETEHGLNIWGARFAPALEWEFDRLRLGVAGRLGFWSIARVTDADPLVSPSLGGALRGSFDVLKPSDASAVFLQAELRGDYYENGPFAPGANLSLGYRWDGTQRL